MTGKPSQAIKISKRTVDAAKAPAKGETWLWDTDLKGFFLRVYATGRKVYAVKCRAGGRQRIHTIGVHSDALTPEIARTKAAEALRRAREGEDPNAGNRAAREALTVAELIERYLTDGPATKPAKRESTWAIDASNLRRHVLPLLGSKIADHVTKDEAARAYHDICAGKTAKDVKTGARGRAIVKGGDGTARRTRTTAAAMFAWGVEHGYVKANPFRSLKLTASRVRERFLTREEIGKLLDALASMEKAGEIMGAVADVIRMLVLTGARKTEITALTWGEVDLGRRRLTLPAERTKAGGHSGERRIVLPPAALDILAKRLRASNGQPDAIVFASARRLPDGAGKLTVEQPVVSIRKPFLKVCARAGLQNVRVHDLRHSFASLAIADGASLPLIGKLLGHASPKVTARYAHLTGDALDDAAEAATRGLFPVAPKAGGEVVQFPAAAS